MLSIQMGSDFLTQNRSWRKKGIDINIGVPWTENKGKLN